MKKKIVILSLFVLCVLIFQQNIANAGYVHSIQIGGDENKETIEYFGEDAVEKVTSKGTVVNYNYITPVAPTPTYYDDSYYYYPYTTRSRYRVVTTYPYVRPAHIHMPPPPRHHFHNVHRPHHPIHRPPMHSPHHPHHGHNRVHVGLPGIHVSF